MGNARARASGNCHLTTRNANLDVHCSRFLGKSWGTMTSNLSEEKVIVFQDRAAVEIFILDP